MAFGPRLDDWLCNAEDCLTAEPGEFTHTHTVRIGGEPRAVLYRIVKDDEHLQAACNLLNDRYGWRGYGSNHSIPSNAHCTTFTAELGGRVVGTVTLGIDSSRGLGLDETFGEELGLIRSTPNAQICELKRLAFDGELRSMELLAGLFHLAFIYGTTFSACSDLLIEVVPRHTAFYAAMLGFQPHGSLKVNTSCGTRSQLMRLKVAAIAEHIRSFAGTTDAASARSLYPYFFSPSEETQIRSTMALARSRARSPGASVGHRRKKGLASLKTHVMDPVGSGALTAAVQAEITRTKVDNSVQKAA